MNLKIYIVIFLAGLILFGCVGGNNPTANQPTTSGASTGTHTSTSGTGSGASASNTSQGTEGTGTSTSGSGSSSTGTSGTGSTSTTAATDLTGKGWGYLVSLDVPIQCTLKYKDASLAPGFQSATMYIKGQKFKEVAVISQGGKTITMTIISRNDGFMYSTYDDTSMMTAMTQGKIQCDGIKTAMDATTDSGSSSTVDTSVLEDTSKVELTCLPAAFGEEMFQVSGKYCTMQEITAALTGGSNPCAQITDPQAKAQCEQAMGQ